MNNRRIWDKVHKPDPTSLKTIGGGRLKGMTDINPQWRFQAATDVFGPCGIGWWYTIKELWTAPGSDGQVMAFARVDVFYRDGETTSHPVEGIGGSMMISKEKDYLYTNDECYKMAVTDALSVAFKALGFGAEIYAGRWDGSKYLEKPKPPEQTAQDELVKKQKAEAIAKLNALPPDIVEGFKIIEVRGKGIWQFCNDREWDHAKIKADINRIADERAK